MTVDPLTAGIELATAAITRIWPDKSAAEAAQLARSEEHTSELQSPY